MKKINIKSSFLVSVFVVLCVNVHAQFDRIYIADHPPTYYVFADQANVRSAAAIDASIIDKLHIGDSLTVAEVSDQRLSLKGIETYWLKINYQKNGIQKEGYIWQGLLSNYKIHEGGIDFMGGIHQMTENDEESYHKNWVLQVKAIQNKQVIAQYEWVEPFADATYVFTKSIDVNDKGIKNINTIIAVSYGGESCGYAVNDCHFMWNGTNFIPLPCLESIPDADYSISQFWIYPNEMKGISDALIAKTIKFEGSIEDLHGNYYMFERYELQTYTWDGQSLGEPITLGASDEPYLGGNVKPEELIVYTQPDKTSEIAHTLKQGTTFGLTLRYYEVENNVIEGDWLEIFFPNVRNKPLSGYVYLPDNR